MADLEKTIRKMIREVTNEAEKNSFLLAKPAAEYAMARTLFEQELQSSGEFTEVAFNTMLAMNVFMDGSLDENERASTSYELEFSLPKRINEQVVNRFFESLYGGSRSGFLTYYTKEELAKMHLYLIKGHNAGFALKGGNDIVSVHNNSELRGLGKFFLNAAKEKGGTMLDHFDGFLSGLYRKNGFSDVYEVYQWDEQYKPAMWSYDTVNILNPKTSIYAEALSQVRQGEAPEQLSLPNENMPIQAESGYSITINPNVKYNQYLYGRPDVILRRV